jgi:hypothetical protein
MRKTNPPSTAAPSAHARSLQEQRQFLARCNQLNRSITLNTTKLREVLRERGWRMVWSPDQQELFWVKSFPDADTQYLTEQDAYWFEQDHARSFLHSPPTRLKTRRSHTPLAFAPNAS